MKTFSEKLLLGLIILVMTMASCKKDKDDDGSELKNHIKYENVVYNLASGLLEYYGDWDGDIDSYNFDIFLYSSGINYVEVNEDFTGQGEFIYFEMFSSSASDLVPGTYTFNDVTYNPNTFSDYSSFAINFNFDNYTGDVEAEITGGTVKIEKSGSTYTITIDCTDEYGKKITGYYKGTLTYIDWSDWAKSTSVEKKYRKN